VKKKVTVLFILLLMLTSCIGEVQKHLEVEKEDCLRKNPGKEKLCMSYFNRASLLYTREPEYIEDKMSMSEYNELFKKALVKLRSEMGLK